MTTDVSPADQGVIVRLKFGGLTVTTIAARMALEPQVVTDVLLAHGVTAKPGPKPKDEYPGTAGVVQMACGVCGYRMKVGHPHEHCQGRKRG